MSWCQCTWALSPSGSNLPPPPPTHLHLQTSAKLSAHRALAGGDGAELFLTDPPPPSRPSHPSQTVLQRSKRPIDPPESVADLLASPSPVMCLGCGNLPVLRSTWRLILQSFDGWKPNGPEPRTWTALN